MLKESLYMISSMNFPINWVLMIIIAMVETVVVYVAMIIVTSVKMGIVVLETVL